MGETMVHVFFEIRGPQIRGFRHDRRVKRYAPMLTALCLVAGAVGVLTSAAPLPGYAKALTLGAGAEWRFHPLLVDLNRDGHLDLLATARLVKNSLHMWLG